MLGRLVIALQVLWPTPVLGQVTGRFYIEKDTFALGEPVFLYFETTNSGTNTQNMHKADPYSFCSGYHIHVSSDLANNSSCAPTFGSTIPSRNILDRSTDGTAKAKLRPSIKQGNAAKSNLCDKSASKIRELADITELLARRDRVFQPARGVRWLFL